MKYLVLVLVLLVAYLLWRNGRLGAHETARRPEAPRAPAGKPQEMVRCAQCGLHLPQADALPGGDGRFYCTQEHRLRAGG